MTFINKQYLKFPKKLIRQFDAIENLFKKLLINIFQYLYSVIHLPAGKKNLR